MEERNIHFLLKEADAFTQAHQQGGTPAARELRCLRVQFPGIFLPIGPDDLFVGFTAAPLVGYRYSWNEECGIGYFCDHAQLRAIAQDTAQFSAEERALAQLLDDYWRDRTTRALWLAQNPDRTAYYHEALAEVYLRLAEVNLDFDRLLRLGIPGLRAEILRHQAAHDLPLAAELLGVLTLLQAQLRFYADEARAQIPTASAARQAALSRLAQTLESCIDHAPDTFYAALCLFHLVVMMTGVDNFARMDVYLGDFLARDLARGVCTREQALALFVSLYRHYDRLFSTTGRIIIGGEGRRNVKNADEMALLILDAAKIVHGEAPTLCLRIDEATDPRLWEKAMDALEAGCSYPLLYNDTVNIPARMRTFHTTREEAAQYIMSNCGEYGLWGRSIQSPNAAINYARVLELALNNGTDPLTGQQLGPQTGDATAMTCFAQVLDAFKAQATYFIQLVSDRLPSIYTVAAADSPNLLMTLLYDDCLATGRGLLDGARYRTCYIETHSLVLVADALTAIRSVVFESQQMTMATLLSALRQNFIGFEAQRALLLHAPKFGNANAQADEMVQQISNFIHEQTAAQAARLGVYAFAATQITVDNYEIMGRFVGATPDGRLAYAPISNSINPTNGSDRAGLTALLRSMSSVDPSLCGGMVHHLKLSPSAFSAQRRGVTKHMIEAFFAAGGGELSIYTVNQRDLIDAVQHPERHQDLVVRIGGYNARFVTLTPALQAEMIARNAYAG